MFQPHRYFSLIKLVFTNLSSHVERNCASPGTMQRSIFSIQEASQTDNTKMYISEEKLNDFNSESIIFTGRVSCL